MESTEKLQAVAERLALTMAQGGMQRTTARVLAALLYAEKETMTAADLCESLSISSGAVSTAVKQLTPAGLIERVPAPGSRRDHYRFPEGAWATLMSQQNAVIKSMHDAALEGIRLVGEDSVAGRRLDEMRDFYAYMIRELIPLIEKWREEYASKRAAE